MTNMTATASKPVFSRRLLLGATAAGIASAGLIGFLPRVQASEAIGSVLDSRGNVIRRQKDIDGILAKGESLQNNDLIRTGQDGFAELALGSDTRVLMGAETEVLIDTFLADQGGTLELISGQMVFDRPEGLPKIDLTLRTTFGQIGVRGTKFFVGKNRGNDAVFVEHGLVEVFAGGSVRKVGAGEGVDIAHDKTSRSAFGGDISPIKKWGKGRIEEAYASVGIKVD